MNDDTLTSMVTALSDLARYVKHRYHCQWKEGESVCTCGLQDALNRARGAIEQAKQINNEQEEGNV